MQLVKGSQYDGFIAVRTHVHSNGLSLMPTAGAFPSPSVAVALHGGMDYDIVAYAATRVGEVPVIPNPRTTNPNRVFLRGGRVGQFPIYDMSGTASYTISGWFLFGILTPEGLASDFYLGNLPIPGLADDNNEYVPGSYFQYGLINDKLTQVLGIIPTPPSLVLQTAIQG